MGTLTRTETERLLGVSRATLFRLVARGLPCTGAGRMRRFDKAQVLAWWNAGPETERDGQGPSPSPVETEGAEMLAPGTYRCGCGWQTLVLAHRRADALVCPDCGVWDDMEPAQ